MGQDTEELRREIESTRTDMSETLDAIGDRVSPGRMMTRSKNRFSTTMGSMRERVMGSAHHAKDQLTGTTESATESVKHMPDMVGQRTAGAPMVAGGIAFGIGFLIAVAFPASKAEEQAAGKAMEALEPVKQDLKESAQQVAQNVKEPAKESMESLKSTASDAAHSVASTAKEASADVKEQAGSSTGSSMGSSMNAGNSVGE